jgi:hypothetical protein
MTNRSKVILLIVAVVFLVLAIAAGFFFWKWIQVKDNPDAVAEETSKRVTLEVGKIYELPGDEEPTVAKVQDKEKLKEQVFFENAQNGDYILIYSKKKLALLYREENKKLINVGPIADQVQDSPAAQ